MRFFGCCIEISEKKTTYISSFQKFHDFVIAQLFNHVDGVIRDNHTYRFHDESDEGGRVKRSLVCYDKYRKYLQYRKKISGFKWKKIPPRNTKKADMSVRFKIDECVFEKIKSVARPNKNTKCFDIYVLVRAGTDKMKEISGLHHKYALVIARFENIETSKYVSYTCIESPTIIDKSTGMAKRDRKNCIT